MEVDFHVEVVVFVHYNNGDEHDGYDGVEHYERDETSPPYITDGYSGGGDPCTMTACKRRERGDNGHIGQFS